MTSREAPLRCVYCSRVGILFLPLCVPCMLTPPLPSSGVAALCPGPIRSEDQLYIEVTEWMLPMVWRRTCTHTHLHLYLYLYLYYNCQNWLRGPHLGGEPAGGNKTGGPVGSGDTSLMFPVAGVLIYGLARPMR